MTVPILTTKLYKPPPRLELVPRPQLVEQLTQSLQGRLTLVSAPAGFGKTTLVSDWLRHVDRPAAWLSLDKDDNDPIRFLAYFIAALQSLNIDLGDRVLDMLHAPQPPAVETILTPLINEIADAPANFIFVFDDYHAIESQAIDRALLFLVDHLPRQMHLVIVGRTDPSLPLPRLRASGQLAEIRADKLRFTRRETAVFLNTVMGLQLSPENVAALETRTEGWIAGLQLAALSMQGLQQASEITAFIDGFTGSKRYIIDYLADEVLQQRPGGTRDFLLQTSILDRLSAPLCDAVTGFDNSQTILETLEAANLFIVPLDDERRWYRYHHLFTDLLRNRLEVLQPELVPDLHRRASTWYEAEDSISEAINHSLAAQDWEKAARLIDQTMNEMMGRGEFFTTMLERLKSLPPEIIRARPHFAVSYAWLLSITLQLDAVEPRLQEVERVAGDQLSDDIRLQITVIRAALARQRGDASTALAYVKRVLEALPEDPAADNPLQREARTGVAFNLAETQLLLQGDVGHARKSFDEALSISREANSLTLTLAATSGLAQVQMLAGQLRQAVATCRQGLRLAAEAARQSGQAVPAAAYLELGLGNLLREWNKPVEAAHHLAHGIELCQQWQMGDSLCDGYIFLARLKQSQGDFSGAFAALGQAEQLPPACQTVPRFGGSIAAGRAQLLLAQAVASGDTASLAAVEQWLDARELQVAGPIVSLNDEYEQLIWARLLITQNKPEQALQLLDRLQHAANKGGRTGSLLKIWALQALAQQALGDEDLALVTIGPALSLAEPEGYIRLFVDEGRPMARLLRRAAARGLAPAYVGKLLDAFKPGISEGRALAAAQPLVEPLSEREIEVLRLVAAGLTNQEIAETLVVALGTVKAHTASIYSKLTVHNRTQAVARARELRIL